MILGRRSLKLKVGVLLAGLGLLFFAPAVYALPPDVSDDIQVTAQVPSDHQMVGATITSPTSGTITSNPFIAVRGTCEPNAYVVVKTNGVLAGSTYCSAGGTYQVQIQLSLGRNVLTAFNFDGLGSPGPSTPSVDVTLRATPSTPPVVTPPTLPDYPKNCRDYTPATATKGGHVRVALVCAPELIEPEKTYKIGIFIWGGEEPYAVSVDWGEAGRSSSLYSFQELGYHELEFSYKEPGTYIVDITVSDGDGYKAFTQIALIVSGESGVPETLDKTPRVNTSWFYSGVPLYVAFGALVLGFWPGYLLGHRVIRRHRRPKAIAKDTSL